MKRLAALAWDFFLISALVPGGGMAMLPAMHRSFVERRKWLSEGEMVDIVATMQSLPGLIVVNMAVLVGYRVKGILGAVVAAFASVAAPFAAMVAVASGRAAFADSPALDHAFLGIRAGVSALILVSTARLSRGILANPVAWAIAVGGFAACALFGVDVTFVVLAAILAGLANSAYCAWKERARR